MFPSIVDLFCGVGGFSLGAAQSGFQPIVGIDIDSDLLSGYRLNFPRARAVQADLREMDRQAWREILGTEKPFGIIGGPPCQGFSRIGKRTRGDARNDLIGCFIDQVCLLRPAFFVMENVEGLLDPRFEGLLACALAKARRHYKLVGPVQINAARVGVPTERHRVIVVGYDPKMIGKLTDKDFAVNNEASVTVEDAIADLPPPNHSDDGSFGWGRYVPADRSAALPEYARRMRKPLPRGIGWATALQKHRLREISGFHSTLHSIPVSRRFAQLCPGAADKISRYIRLKWDGRSPTLRAGTGVERGSFQAARPIHPDCPRVITVREAARLQGFPDVFVFHRTKWHSFRMIGNSVSPPVARNVIEVIRRKINPCCLTSAPKEWPTKQKNVRPTRVRQRKS